jgi:hypothetical protein
MTFSTIDNPGTIIGLHGANHRTGPIQGGGFGGTGVDLVSGELDNSGLIVGGTGGYSLYLPGGAGGAGVHIGSTADVQNEVVNTGTIQGGDSGYEVVPNPSNPYRSSGGVGIASGGGNRITNDGLIAGGNGVVKSSSGRGANGGAGVSLQNADTLINNGTVEGGNAAAGYFGSGYRGTGVNVYAGALVINAGSINGNIGVFIDGGTVATNGTISGSDAVLFGGLGGVLEIDPGAVFSGAINGSGTASTIAFAGSGVETTTNYSHFSGINAVTIAANWTLAGVDGNSTAGGTGGVYVTNMALTNFGAIVGGDGIGGGFGAIFDGGTLINDGEIAGGSGIGGGIGVYVQGGGTLVNDGTIAGGLDQNGNAADAVTFGYTAATLVLVAGYSFTGAVSARSNIDDKLVFGGTITSTASTSNDQFSGFSGFTELEIDAAWTVQGQQGHDGLSVLPGQTLTNYGTIDSGAGGAGVYIDGGTLVAFGTISGDGGQNPAVRFGTSAGAVIVEPGAVFDGHVVANAAAQDVLTFAGTSPESLTTVNGQFTNYSQFNIVNIGANWLIEGSTSSGNGVGYTVRSGTTVTNAGTIAGVDGADGAYLDGGTLITSGTILGSSGVAIQFVGNAGTLVVEQGATFGGEVIADTSVGDTLIFGGTTPGARQTADGTIAGYQNFTAISIGSAWSLTGAPNDVGLEIDSGLTLTNAGSVASGAGASGVFLNGGTLINSGTISGDDGTAVQFGSLASTLEIDAGFSFSSSVSANSTVADRLVLGGTISAQLGSTAGQLNEFSGFTETSIGSAWQINGTSGDAALALSNGLTLKNNGTIIAGGGGSLRDHSFVGGVGVDLTAGGVLGNGGTIDGGAAGYFGMGGAGADVGATATIDNSGIITGGASGHDAGGNAGIGVVVLQGGIVTNSGAITGGAGNGVLAGRPQYGIGGAGAQIQSGGMVTNTGTIRGGASAYGAPVRFTPAPAVSGDGVDLDAGATLVNDGTIIGGRGYSWHNAGAAGGTGVSLAAGASLDNNGTIIGGRGSAGFFVALGSYANDGAGGDGVVLGIGATLNNNAQIYGGPAYLFGAATLGGNGARVEADALLNNAAAIKGVVAAYIDGGTVVNAGTLQGIDAVQFGSLGGTLIVDPGAVLIGAVSGNPGVADEIDFVGTASSALTDFDTEFQNIATINIGANWSVSTAARAGTGAAGITLGQDVVLADNGTIVGGAGGAGDRYGASGGAGVSIDGGTLIAGGTIGGGAAGIGASGSGPAGNAVQFGSLAGRLIVDPGAVFDGDVVANPGLNDTLELAGTAGGILSGIGSQFTGFTTLTVDSGANWTLSHANTLADSTSLAIDGRLTVSGHLKDFGSASIAAGATLGASSGAVVQIADVQISGGTLDGAAGVTLVVGDTQAGAAAGAITVQAGYSITGYGAIGGATLVDNGVVDANGGTLSLLTDISGTGSVTIDAGATLAVSGALSVGSVHFAAGGGSLLLSSSEQMTATIYGFGTGSTIDLLNQTSLSLDVNGSVLTLSQNGAALEHLEFAGNYSAANFALQSDGEGGTDIEFIATDTGDTTSPDFSARFSAFDDSGADAGIGAISSYLVSPVILGDGIYATQLTILAGGGVSHGSVAANDIDGIYAPADIDGVTILNQGEVGGSNGVGAGIENAPGQGGPGGDGIDLRSVAYVTNEGRIYGGRGGYSFYGFIYASAGAGGVGIALIAGGSIDNSGTITGGPGGADRAFTAENYGGTGGAGVWLGQNGTVENSGAIRGADAGYTNTGFVPGHRGVDPPGGAGIYFSADGSVSNTGTITGGFGLAKSGEGIFIGGVGTIDNSGSIQGGGNPFGGNGGFGVYLDGGTLINSGTISGGPNPSPVPAVELGSLAATVVIDPGAVFNGGVSANATVNDVIELAGTTAATLTGIGSSFTGFSTFDFDRGATWSIEGSVDALAGGQTINGFVMGDTIVLDGFAANSETFSQGSELSLSDGNTVFDLDLTGDFTNGRFQIANNGSNTTLTIAPLLIVHVDGTITQQITPGDNVYAETLTVGATGIITPLAGGGDGVHAALTGISLTNLGSIVGGAAVTDIAGSPGVYFPAAGTLDNGGYLRGGLGGEGSSGAQGGAGALFTLGGAATNSGTIHGGSGGAGDLAAGGAGGIGVYLAIGSLTNSGLIDGGDGGQAYRTGNVGGTGVVLVSDAALTNTGSVTGGAGGISTNTVEGAVYGGGGAGGVGVQAQAGATLINAGHIAGGTGGASYIQSYNPGYGDGKGGAGVTLESGAMLTNTGTIAGGAGGTGNVQGGAGGIGVSIDGGTLITAGRIAGGHGAGSGAAGDAVSFGNLGGTLVIDAGAAFVGNVAGDGAGNSHLDLASGAGIGTLSGLGGKYSGFQTVTIDSGATWDVTGSISGFDGVAISGFDNNDRLDLTDVAFNAGDTTAFNDGTDILTIRNSAGAIIDSLQMAGTFTANAFHLTSDGASGSYVTEDDPACFVRGTMILTPSGEVAVETLAIGDLIATLDGSAHPIVWIGKGRSLVTPKNPGARPVIIRRNALADGVPSRDLYLTKAHSLYLDGVLIPVEFLLNGHSVLWDDHSRVVEYYHLELPAHGVIIANGAPSESFKDEGNRDAFMNADRPAGIPHSDWFAPVTIHGPTVDTVWRRLFERSGKIVPPLTDDPDLHLLADGVRIAPQPGTHRFVLDRAPFDLRIVSRSASPQSIGRSADSRPLGVAIHSIAISGRELTMVLPFDSPLLDDGFHNAEVPGKLRWTKGEAPVPSRALLAFEGVFEVTLELAGTMKYPAGVQADQSPETVRALGVSKRGHEAKLAPTQ